ncbi:hypothetical protein KAT36_01630 [Candidatus Pacearchaeota archaeon]|nr:hypothetical protein [Candidatus Pacearchaeota archaeon]
MFGFGNEIFILVMVLVSAGLIIGIADNIPKLGIIFFTILALAACPIVTILVEIYSDLSMALLFLPYVLMVSTVGIVKCAGNLLGKKKDY